MIEYRNINIRQILIKSYILRNKLASVIEQISLFVTKIRQIIHFHYKSLNRFNRISNYGKVENVKLLMNKNYLGSMERTWKGLDYEFEMEL